jgi:hypothetical protein
MVQSYRPAWPSRLTGRAWGGTIGRVKRLLGLLSAIVLLAVAGAGTRVVDANRDKAVRKDALRAAESAGMRASDALLDHVAELKLKVQNATANPRLAAALRGNVDAATLRDLFRSEDWWQPYRTEFKVYAIAFETEHLDIVEGMKGAEFASDLLVREARERREPVSEIVMGKGWPYAAAAVVAPVPERPIAPVLVLAKPIDEEAVRKLSEKAQGAVLLSDGKAAVIEAGSESERNRLRGAVGAEGQGPLYAAPGGDGSWAAAVSTLAPGLWMWTLASAATAHEAESSAAVTKAVIWSVASLLAILALVLGFRRGAAAPAPASMMESLLVEGGEPRNTSGGTGALAEGGMTMTGGVALARTRIGGTPSAPRPTTGAAGSISGSAATDFYAGQAPLPAAAASRALTFGRYTLLDRLGEGGMAEVYTAVTFGAEGFRRTFVVKRLRAELAREPAVVAQFIDEANLGSTLVHSNIVPVFDFGKVGDEYFLAQEYILGRDLSRVTIRALEQELRPLPVPVILHVAHETLKALEYAHTKLGDGGKPMGIVHRDVSPNNVLVSARGEVKLFDFGIVKAEGRVTKTQHGVVKGNVSFMSPEQARGGDVDARADLFSLGLVIFYCLTGEVLYRGNTTYELLVKAATGPGPDELDRIAALPAPCPAILGQALQIDPAARYQSAAEFGVALIPHIGGAAGEVGSIMRRLFAADFQQEEAHFAAAVPTGDKGSGSTGGTQELVSRRS